MLPTIRAFRKTSHFLYRQWDRSIDDQLLLELMRHLPPQYDPDTKHNLLFSYQYCQTLPKRGFFVPQMKKHECLVISLKNFALITVYTYHSANLMGIFAAHRGESFTIIL